MTLQYEMQLLDELPMLWSGCIIIYCMAQVRAPIKQENVTLALTLATITVTLSIIHLTFKIAIIFFVSSLFSDVETLGLVPGFELQCRILKKKVVHRDSPVIKSLSLGFRWLLEWLLSQSSFWTFTFWPASFALSWSIYTL